MPDPVSKQLDPPVIENCFWGWPPGKDDGLTQGCYCGYCRRHYVSQIQSTGKSMKDWEAIVGLDDKSIGQHHEKIQIIVTQMAKNASRRCHINWDMVERVSLQRVESLQLKIKHPGWRHLGLAAYAGEFGDLETNGKQALGHRRCTVEGVDGVMVPQKDERIIEFSHAIESQIKSKHDFAQGFALAMDENRQNLRNLMTGGANELMAGGGLASGSGALPLSLPAALPAPSPPAAAPGAQSSGMNPAALTFPFGVGIGQGSTGSGAAAIQGGGGAPPAPAANKKSRAKAKPAPAPPSGAQAGQQAQLAITDKKQRGRPQKDLSTEVKSLALELERASPHDQLLFGTEAKTGIKQFEDLNKTVQGRLRRATLESDILELRSYLKFSSAVHAVLSVVASHGLQVQEFAEEMDKQDTLLNLEPSFKLVWPAHLQWARHRMSIRTTTDAELWTTQVSSPELRSRGVQESDVAPEQDKLVAEKLVTSFREPAWDTCVESLRAIFGTLVEWPFEEGPQEFCAALAIAVHLDDFDSLESRLTFASDAVDIFDTAARNKTTCGNALAQWPKGKKLVSDLRLDVQCCTFTRTRITGMHTARQRLEALVDQLPVPKDPSDLGGILQLEHDTFVELTDSITECDSAWNPTLDGIVSKFLPTLEEFAATNSELVLSLYGGAKNVLHMVLTAECSTDMLAEWNMSMSDSFDRVVRMHGVLSNCKHFLNATEGMLAEVTSRLVNVARWLKDLNHAIVGEFKDTMLCEQIWKSAQSCVWSPVPVINEPDGDWASIAVCSVQRSPLMDLRESTMMELRRCALQPVEKLMVPILSGREAFPGNLADLSFGALDAAGVDAVAQLEVDDKAYAAASKWARDAGDSRFESQLATLFAVMTLVKNLARVESLSRLVVRSDASFAVKKMSPEAVAQLVSLRAASASLNDRNTDECAAAMVQQDSPCTMHCDKLEGILPAFTSVAPHLLKMSNILQDEFKSLWTRHATELTEHLQGVLPTNWDLGKDGVLGHDDLCRALLANTGGYQRAGALCTEAVRVLDTCKPLDGLGRRGQFMPDIFGGPTRAQLKVVASEAVTMVCYTYCVFHVRKEIPTFTNTEKVGMTCQDIRSRFKAHKVKLPDDMHEALTGLTKGTTPAGAYLLASDVASPPSSGAVASGGAALSPSSGSGALPGASTASGAGVQQPPVAPVGAVGVSPAVVGGAPAPKRARLMDRLRMTK